MICNSELMEWKFPTLLKVNTGCSPLFQSGKYKNAADAQERISSNEIGLDTDTFH